MEYPQHSHQFQIQEILITELVLLMNPKIHPRDQIEDMKNSLKTFGFVDPCIVGRGENHSLVLLAGYCRLQAAIELGLESVPCRLVDLKPEAFMAYILTEGRIAEKASWDYEAFVKVYGEMGDESKEILCGWTPDDIDNIRRWQTEQIAPVEAEVTSDEPRTPPPLVSKVEIVLSFPLSVWEQKQEAILVSIDDAISAYTDAVRGVPKIKK
jgi:hypothetical protein